MPRASMFCADPMYETSPASHELVPAIRRTFHPPPGSVLLRMASRAKPSTPPPTLSAKPNVVYHGGADGMYAGSAGAGTSCAGCGCDGCACCVGCGQV